MISYDVADAFSNSFVTLLVMHSRFVLLTVTILLSLWSNEFHSWALQGRAKGIGDFGHDVQIFELFVEPNGSSAGDLAENNGRRDGSFRKTFRNLHEARDAIRKGWGKGSTRIVRLLPGVHYLKSPLELQGDLDSGDLGHPIIWKADSPRQGDSPTTISGGVRIPATAFEPFPEMPNGVEGILVADLFEFGFTASDLGQMASPYPNNLATLYVDGVPQILARSPNIAEDGTWLWYGYDEFQNSTNMSFALRNPTVVKNLAPAIGEDPGLWLHGYWKYDWRDSYVKIDSIKQPEGIFTRNASTVPWYGFTDGARFYAVNSLTFLDQPSEYFIDPSEGKLYFFPRKPLDPGSLVVVSHLEYLIVGSNLQHVTFENLKISDCRSSAIALTTVNDVNVLNNDISNSGDACVYIIGESSNIEGNSVSNCAKAGIVIDGGNTTNLIRSNNRVVGNAITNMSLVVRTYQPGIGFSGVGHYIAHNTISNGPHTAMTGSGLFNIFEYNNISGISFECTDSGAFYVGRHWDHRGNIVRYNRFDTIRSTQRLAQKTATQNAFYLDDQISGYDFYGNIMVNCTVGVLLGGGRKNRIFNNYFLNNDLDIFFDNRGMSWQSSYCNYNCSDATGKVEPSCFRNQLEAVHYKSPPYSSAFPELKDIFDDHPCVPVHNEISNNRYCHSESKNGGKFIDKSSRQIRAWMSSISDNRPKCHDQFGKFKIGAFDPSVPDANGMEIRSEVTTASSSVPARVLKPNMQDIIQGWFPCANSMVLDKQ